jgi:hypothetical protein
VLSLYCLLIGFISQHSHSWGQGRASVYDYCGNTVQSITISFLRNLDLALTPNLLWLKINIRSSRLGKKNSLFLIPTSS